MSRFAGVKLHVVTGKGGTGKTTAAAALALAIAGQGKTVLLTEVEGRQGLAQLFDCPPLPYEERRVAVSSRSAAHGEVYALAVDPEAALIEYLEIFYNLRRAGAALKRLGAIDFATTIAPGLRDVLLTGKVMEAATRERRGGGRLYDAVVLDAPPTGRIARFLNVNSEVAGLARMGPVRQQADSVMNLLRSSKTAVHLVTVLEEMPVQETVDGVTELRDTGLPVGAVVVNMVRQSLLPEGSVQAALDHSLDAEEIGRGLKRAGIDAGATTVSSLMDEAADHAFRIELETQERITLHELGQPMVELPWLADAANVSGLYELADRICEQDLI